MVSWRSLSLSLLTVIFGDKKVSILIESKSDFIDDLDKFLEEVSAVMDKKTLLKIYHECTKEPYSFLYVKLTAKTIEEMFYSNFNKRVSFAEDSESLDWVQRKKNISDI